MKYDHIFGLVGNTPHVRIRADEVPKANLYLKLEGQNPTGSVKDRPCIHLLGNAVKEGRLKAGRTILDASSGNMACALAFFGKIMGYPVKVIANAGLTEDKAAFITYFGAELVRFGGRTIDGNHHCRRLQSENPHTYCFLDQFHNWDNPNAHYQSTGPEIYRDFPRLAMVVASIGSGGTLTGTGRYLKEHLPAVKIAAVQSAKGSKLPGTGAFEDGDFMTPFLRQGREDGLIDFDAKITLEAAVSGTARLRDQGFFCGIQTGGVFRGALEIIKRQGIEGDVVLISGDSGWKNMQMLTEADL